MGYSVDRFNDGQFVPTFSRAQYDRALALAQEASETRPETLFRIARDGKPLVYIQHQTVYTMEDMLNRLAALLADAAPVIEQAMQGVAEAVSATTTRTKRKAKADEAADDEMPAETKTRQRTAAEHKAFSATVINVDQAEGIVEAIVNVFGIIDDGDDVIHTGAFVKTLNERFNRIRVLNSHNWTDGLNVIGKPLEIRELSREELATLAPEVLEQYPEATGALFTRTQYLLDTPEGEGIFKRIASGALGEYSIGFDPVEVDMSKLELPDGKTRRVRNIRQVRLWEYSPVVWGMNPATSTIAAKKAGGTAAKEWTGEGPNVRIGDRLIAATQRTLMAQISRLLEDGYIDADEHSLLSTLANDIVEGLKLDIPTDISERPFQLFDPFMFLWGADGPDDTKDADRQRMRAAAAILTGQMPGAGHPAARSDDAEPATQAGSRPESAPTPEDGAGPQTGEAPTDETVLALRAKALKLRMQLEED